MIFKKILFKFALAFGLICSFPLSATFTPLTEGDERILTTTYPVPFDILVTIEAVKLQNLPKKYKNKLNPAALESDFIEIEKENKGLTLNFDPYATVPSILMPENFPLDMYKFLVDYLTRQDIDLNKEFRYPESDITIWGTDLKIGSRIMQYPFSPAYFLEQFEIRRKILSKISLMRICQNNRDLMNTARFIFEDHNVNLHDITFPRVKELSTLLAYALGVNVLDNPEAGVSLQINNYKISSKGKMKPETYKRKLKREMRDTISSLNLTYSPERHALVFLEKKA